MTAERTGGERPGAAMLKDLALGDVESASTSTRMLANLIAAKKRRHQP